MNQMLDPHQNPVRDQPWPDQIEHFHLDVAPRTLRAAFNQRRPRVAEDEINLPHMGFSQRTNHTDQSDKVVYSIYSEGVASGKSASNYCKG